MRKTIKTIKTITKEQVLEAAVGATTISEVARRLGLCRGKLDGRTAGAIRAAAPGLDGILKAGRKPSTESTGKGLPELPEIPPTESRGRLRKPSGITKPPSDNPYRPGSTYEAIFREGSRRFLGRQELIGRVAAITGKPASCISFSLAVLSHRLHSSNIGRSTAICEGGKIQLVALRRKNRIH